MKHLGTVVSVTGAGVPLVAADLDASATGMPADVYVPASAPAAGDRVLYETVDGLLVVTANITRPTRASYGGVTLTCPSAGTTVSQVVPFPAGLFTKTPGISITEGTAANGTSIIQDIWATLASTTGFTLNLSRNDTSPVFIRWTAVQAG